MTYSIRYATQANRQLEQINDYLESVGAETDFVDRIIDRCESLATFPFRNKERLDIGPGIRVMGYKKRVTIPLFSRRQHCHHHWNLLRWTRL